MPELPEVETIKLGLEKYVVGHKVLGIDVKDKKLFSGEAKNVIGAKIAKIRRFGKGLVIDFSNKYSIAVHIKLTGQLIYRDRKTHNLPVAKPYQGTVPNKFTRVIFVFDRDSFLYFNDVRRFAWMRIVKTSDVEKFPFFKELGPEPFVGQAFSGRAFLTIAKFREIVLKSNSAIKTLIMDQKKISGVGNIYTNDALYKAGIDPKRSAKSLSEKEIKLLYDAILFVLKKGLQSKGASELSFVNVLGQEGEYQNHTLVYGKRGQKCKKCQGDIKFIRIGGRGTYFCSACQR